MSHGGRKAAVALWGAFAAIAAISCVLVARRDNGLSDLHIYYGAIQHLHAGRPLYDFVAENGGPFTYPPFAAVVMWPIAFVPEGLLQAAWLAATVAALAAIAVLVGRACGSGRPVVVAAVACGLLLSAPAQSNLRFGQMSVFVVLLSLVDGLGWTPARYRGLLIGVAAAIKLTPLLFVVYFLVVGRYRDAARAGGAFVVCAAIGALLLPAESATFWTGTIAETSRIGNLASLGNQSVQGALLRLGLSPSALPLVWAALVAVICGIALLRARQIEHSGQMARAAVLVGCATVAASPVSWTHHQIWLVLAAMLLIATQGTARRVAGVALLTTMVLSLGVVLRGFALTPGVQFALENARAFGAVGVCVLGFGGVAVAAARRRRVARRWAVTAAVATGLAVVAVQPLPAAADPTFKAYSWEHTSNPRYFYVCHDRAGCADFIGRRAIRFVVTAEKTKVRVNGVVDARVGRLEYHSAPGGAPREIPLLALYPEHRVFSFRSASLSHGRLVVYDVAGRPLVTYIDELAPPPITP